MVKAAYSSGKPAYGVGPGNVPAFIERTTDIKRAVSDIFGSKTFDNGTICASEQAIVTESVIENQVVEEVRTQGGYFLSDPEAMALARVVVGPGGNISPSIVGRSATTIARMAGLSVPDGTRVLLARLAGVGPDYPLSREKLSPILAFYVEPDWQAACERCIEILRFGGVGHSLVIHSRNAAVIREFAMKKPVFRILVNTPSSQGAIGATTGLDPALTLGCGTWGGSITGDNVGPLHLINVKRVAYGLASEDVDGLYEETAAGAGTTVVRKGRDPSSAYAGSEPLFRGAAAGEPGPRRVEAAPGPTGRRPVPTIVGPAAAVDRPVVTPLPTGGRVQKTAGPQEAARGQAAGRPAHQTRLVTDEDIRVVVDRFLSELKGAGSSGSSGGAEATGAAETAQACGCMPEQHAGLLRDPNGVRAAAHNNE